MTLPQKLDRILVRVEELRHALNTADGAQVGAIARELSELDPLVEKVGAFRAAERGFAEAEAMLADPEMRELAEAEYLDLKDLLPKLEREIRLLLAPRDMADERSAILKSAPPPGAMRRRCSRRSCSAPISAMPSARAGASRSWTMTKATSAA